MQKKFAEPDTIYDKEFHFFDNTLQEKREEIRQEEELNRLEEESKHHSEEKALRAASLTDSKQEANKQTIES
jgi:hypothetical protein